jgi:hypothetical protein
MNPVYLEKHKFSLSEKEYHELNKVKFDFLLILLSGFGKEINTFNQREDLLNSICSQRHSNGTQRESNSFPYLLVFIALESLFRCIKHH